MKKYLMIMAMFLSLTGCAMASSSSQPIIDLKPQVDLSSVSNVGHGTPVALQVSDVRPANKYGAAVINPQQNVSQLFTQQISKALNSYGFVVNPSSQNQLTIQIMTIDYRALAGYLGSSRETFVTVQASAKNPTGTYTNVYNASAYSDNYLKSDSQSPSDQVNTVVNQLLSNMLHDSALMQFLAKGK